MESMAPNFVIKVKRLKGEGYDALIYAAGHVAFRPAQCLAPSP
ncbi:hypothetical protein CCACVL1_18223 [Corchorus capsularis]|uniref:Uncharacterized protein n=1 Tax=Corchorus capsularis TaxID=210143 RepID=A0A1R3HM24_COCAP|nr:hypothetical protein CCACVL1_18223 [Corchorus capsularis]